MASSKYLLVPKIKIFFSDKKNIFMPFFLQKSTLFVDGGYRQWVRCENPSTTAQVTYFVLKGQTTPASKKPKFAEYDIHDMGGNIKAWTHGKVTVYLKN